MLVGKVVTICLCTKATQLYSSPDDSPAARLDECPPWTLAELSVNHIAMVLDVVQPIPVVFRHRVQEAIFLRLMPLALTPPDVNRGPYDRLSTLGQLMVLQKKARRRGQPHLMVGDLLDQRQRAPLFMRLCDVNVLDGFECSHPATPLWVPTEETSPTDSDSGSDDESDDGDGDVEMLDAKKGAGKQGDENPDDHDKKKNDNPDDHDKEEEEDDEKIESETEDDAEQRQIAHALAKRLMATVASGHRARVEYIARVRVNLWGRGPRGWHVWRWPLACRNSSGRCTRCRTACSTGRRRR